MNDVVVIGGIFREIHEGRCTPPLRLGGSGLLAAIISLRLGAKTALVGVLGEEDAPTVRLLLDAAGVDGESLLTIPGASGTFVFPSQREGDDHPWPMYRPAEGTPRTSPVIPGGRVYLSFGIPDFDPVGAGWLDGIEADAILIWDRQGWLSRARDSTGAGRLPPKEKIYVANLSEAKGEFASSSERDLVLRLPPPGYAAALIKRGAEGCTVVATDGYRTAVTRIASFPVPVDSTIGSGDAFAGALAAELAVGVGIDDSGLLATAVASAFLEAERDPWADGLPERARALVAMRRRGRADGHVEE